MNQYEYATFEFTDLRSVEDIKRLNRFGQEGWRIIETFSDYLLMGRIHPALPPLPSEEEMEDDYEITTN